MRQRTFSQRLARGIFSFGKARHQRNIFAGSLFALALLFSAAVASPVFATCSAGQSIDLAEYMIPTPSTPFTLISCGGTEAISTSVVDPSTINAGPDRLPAGVTAVKLNKNANYEMYGYDSNRLYFFEDISWNQTCGGREAFYRVYNPSGQWGGEYQRFVNVGGSYSSPQEVRAFDEEAYRNGQVNSCSNPYTGATTTNFTVQCMQADDQYGPMGLPAGSDTIVIVGAGGAGAGERKYYTKGYGLTGFYDGSFMSTFASANPRPLICGARDPTATLPPTFIYPRDKGEAEKYLANSQVYCSDRFGLKPDYKGDSPPIRPCTRDSNVGVGLPADAQKMTENDDCNAYEYPIVPSTETTILGSSASASFSFPLFRNDAGGLSIEGDLSKIDPNETILNALRSISRPNVAPQFYLNSPTTQCTNMVHFIKYVKQACAFSSPRDPLDKCKANASVTIEGSTSPRRLLDFESTFPDETSCANIGKDIADNNDRAKALRSITPAAPKLFKMAFLVQYTYYHSDNLFQSAMYMAQQIASWFVGTNPLSTPFFGEKLDVIPVWYNAGIATDSFDEFNSGGTMKPFAYDPASLTGHDKASERPQQKNFLGAWTNTYEALLAPQFQDAIAERRMRTVYENWKILQQSEGQWNAPTVNFSVDGVTVAGGIGPIIACATPKGGGPGEACACFKEDGAQCLNQKWSDVVKAFPKAYTTENPDPVTQEKFIRDLKQLIIARVRGGVQRTAPFDDSGINPVLSKRSFNRCPSDPQNAVNSEPNTGDGVQEKTNSLGSSAMQNPQNVLDRIVNAFNTKVSRDTGLIDNDPVNRRETQTFVILPDEALTIETAQAYIAPMFLSPEMYANIYSGKNDILPLEKMATTQKREPFLSAFLRTFGLQRQLNNQDEGYVHVQPVYYSGTPSCTEPGCNCVVTNQVETGRGPLQWVPKSQFEESEDQLSCSTPQITKLTKVGESTVNAIYDQTEKKGNANPEMPGQFAAVNEFVRRLAFTPLHMQQYTEYPGLETFYGGGGQGTRQNTNLAGLTTTGLSAYFQAMVSNMHLSYTSSAPPANSCNALYVDRATAQRYGDDLLAAFQKMGSVPGYMYTNKCDGQSCGALVVSTATSVPVCNGNMFVNPLMAVAIGLNESPSIGDVGFHFGCNVPAFTTYREGGQVDGMACSVQNGAGNVVLNPGISAKYVGDNLTQAVSDACLLPTSARNAAANRNNTFADGLACMMTKIEYGCVHNENDFATLAGYGYNTSDTPGSTGPAAIISRIDEVATLLTRANPGDAGAQATAANLRRDATELRANLARCSQ